MKKYVLIGIYENSDNAEILAESDDIKDLKKERDTADMIAQEREEMADGYAEITETCQQLLDQTGLNVYDDSTGYLREVEISGIYEIKRVKQ